MPDIPLIQWALKRRIFIGCLAALFSAALASSSAATFSADQTSVTLTAAPGEASSSVQVNISTSSSTPISFSPTRVGSWMTIYVGNASVDSSNPVAIYIVGNAANYTSPTTLNGTVTLTNTANPSDKVTISVTFNIGTGGSPPPSSTLVPSQTNVNFNYPPGTNDATSVQVTVNAAAGASTTAFSAAATTQSGGQWLVLVCQSSCSNQAIGSQLTLKIDSSVAANLSNGIYQGTVTLTNTASSSDQATISVTLSVGTGGSTGPSTTLVPTQSSVSFSYAPGACGTTATQITVNANASTTTAFSAVATTQSGGQWLIMTCQNGCSNQPVGSQLTLQADPSIAANLGTGVYQGTIVLTNTASSTDKTTIAVTLSINTAISTGTSTGTLASPGALTFAYPTANGAFPFQTILINGTNPTVVQSSNGGFPCGAGISYALTGNTVLVSVSGTGFQIGNAYSGSITVSSSLGTQTIPVAVTTFGGPTLIASPGSVTCQPSQGACPSNVLMLQMSDNSTRALTVTASVPWVHLDPAGCGTTTPATCTVNIDQSGLGSSLNNAILTANATGAANSPILIPVSVLITGALSFSSNSLSFTTAGTAQQSVSVSSDPATNFAITYGVNTPQGGSWLSATASSTTTPATVTVTVGPAGLSPGQYTGYITLTASGAPAQTITVNLTVPSNAGGNVGVSSATPLTSLTFAAQAGGSPPAAQQILITGTSGSPSVAFAYNTSASWLLVNNTQSGQSATPTSLSVSVNPATLFSGTQTGTITITPIGGQVITVNVTLILSTPVSISAAPQSLTFSYTSGTTAPTAQIQVSGNGGALPFTATATSTGKWLAVSPASGTTAAGGSVPLTVSFQNLSSLAPSSTPYIGTITVAGTGGAATVTVSLTVLPPLPTIVKVTNAASLNSGPVSPGEVVTVLGQNLGPDPGVALPRELIVNSRIPTTLSGVQVLVNGFPAPILYAGSTQISAIVPYEIASAVPAQNLSLQVTYLGQGSNGFPLTQGVTAPGIFTANSSGSGPGAILNADGSTNYWANPANKGDTVVLLLTGEGQTNPAGITGAITPTTPPYPQPIQVPTVTIGGEPAPVVFYAESPGMVAGILQLNVTIPSGVPSGDLPVVVSFGKATSQLAADGTGAVTISVR